MLAREVGYPHCMLTVVSVGYSLVGTLLKGFITMSGFSELNFAILHLSTTINDGGKSKRSSDLMSWS